MAGLFKKVVISSYVSSAIVTPVFTSPSQHSAPEAIFAAWGYAVQIYCDFSGYTDIAIGLALLLGFRFPQNFDAPYTARNLQDFWRRWHMTLSRWLRDYLYIPLGGNSGGQAADRPQHHDHDGAGRPLARRGVDVHDLGGPAGAGPELRAPAPHQPGAPGAARGGRRARAGLGAAVLDVPVRLPRLGVLQRRPACRRPSPCSAAWSSGWGEASPLVTPLLVFTVVGTIALQFVPT